MSRKISLNKSVSVTKKSSGSAIGVWPFCSCHRANVDVNTVTAFANARHMVHCETGS